MVAQEQMALSTAPVWQDGKLQPRPLVLRVFLCATPSGGYTVLPGGLTRVSSEPGRLVVSMQRGGGSKDTWVLAARRAEVAPAQARPALATEPTPAVARPAANDLPSRVADGLYWLGRYAERSEGAVRLLRATQSRLTDGNTPGASAQLRSLLTLLAAESMIPWELTRVTEAGGGRGLRDALHSAVIDPEHPNSLRAQILRLHRIAYSVRDRLSMDMWRVISSIDRHSQPPKVRLDAAALLLRMDDLMTCLAAIAGLEQESMTRGPGWRFLDIGRRIERALHTVAIMRGIRIAELDRQDEAVQSASLAVLLELGESVMTYRARYLTSVQRTPVLELLLGDETNPRALAFQLAALERHLSALPNHGAGSTGDPTGGALSIVAAARSSLRKPEALRSSEALHTLLDALAMSLPDISNFLAHAYFSHAFARSA